MRDLGGAAGRAVRWAVTAGCLAVSACGPSGGDPAARHAAALTGGDPDRGPARMRAYGCSSCHTIPGVPGAHSEVGPPLGGIARRMYVAGVLANTPDNLVRWIRHPTQVDPNTAMPDMGVTEQDARDIAAYLYTLR
jgi:cytochrome c2